MTKPSDGVLWRGVSHSIPIAAVVTGTGRKSENVKTGDMQQLWVLVEGMSALKAVETGADVAVCGDCPLRGDGVKNRGCYVDMMRAPNTVSRILNGGSAYPGAKPRRYGEGQLNPTKPLRLGAYGDPGMVPWTMLRRWIEQVPGWTGYTHQWKKLSSARHGRYLMASCDTLEEVREARRKGWRAFLVRPRGHQGQPMEGRWAQCPASVEAGSRTTCAKCGLCSGNDGKGSVDVWINAHGTGARFAEQKMEV